MRIDRFRLLLVLPLALLLGMAFIGSSAHAQPGCPNAKPGKFKVKIDSTPPGAAVYIDSKTCPSVGVTPWTGMLNKGDITVIIEVAGYEPATKVFKVANVRKQQDLFVPLTRRPQIEIRADADKNLVGATVSVDGQPQGQVQGPLIINATAARHLIEIKKDGFETLTQWVDLTTTPSIVLTPALKEIKKFGSVLVEADVPDAEVYIDQNKHPDKTTTTITNVSVGVHVIEVKKDGQSWTKTISVTEGPPIKVRAELTAGVGVVRVMSDTAGARASIDSIDKGPVPVDIKDIKAGDHIIQIKAAGFKTYEEKVVVAAGSSRTVKKELDADVPANSGTLKVVANIPEAEIFIDSKPAGKDKEQKLPEGEYLVQVRYTGYKQFEQKVKIVAGKTETIMATLKKTGRIRVLSTPVGATVNINGFQAGKTPLETEVETGEAVLRIEMAGFTAFEQTMTIEGGDKITTISRELALAGKSEGELELEQKGLSSFGARTLPRGRSTVDFDGGYPYFLNARITVGGGAIAKQFGFDATIAVRTMFARTELGLGGRAMFTNADPFSAGIFTNIWWGSKLFDDSRRNGVTFDAGGLVSLTALSNVTITGRGYFELWSDRHCPSLDASQANGFDGTDPTAVCSGYLSRVIRGEDPADFSVADQKKAEKLTGQSGNDFFSRDAGARFMLSLIGEIAVDQHWNVFAIIEGAPFQGKDERALFTNLFSGSMPDQDYLFYARFGFTYKF